MTGCCSGLVLQIKYAVDDRILEAHLALGANAESFALTRATVRAVASLRDKIRASSSEQDAAFHELETSRIDQFLNNSDKFAPAEPITAPPGMPIGDIEWELEHGCPTGFSGKSRSFQRDFSQD